MSTEANKQLVRRFVTECVQAQNPDIADEFIHPDWRSQKSASVGLDGFKEEMAMGTKMIQFTEINIEDLVAEDDKVALRETVIAKHIGELYGIPATGKHLNFALMAIYRIYEGKIIEQWVGYNALEILQQLKEPEEEG